jgi:hypothetical protein
MTEAAAISEALFCVFTAITEVLSPPRRQMVVSILRKALDQDLIEDPDARRLVEWLWRSAAEEKDDECDPTPTVTASAV